MSKLSRRKLITTGLVATAGGSGLAVAARLAQSYGLIPPDAGGLYGAGETLTYAAQRLLTHHSLAREFAHSQISKRRSRTQWIHWAKRSSGFKHPASLTGVSNSMAWSPARHRSRLRNSGAFPCAARSLIWRAKRAGLTLPNGSACRCLTS